MPSLNDARITSGTGALNFQFENDATAAAPATPASTGSQSVQGSGQVGPGMFTSLTLTGAEPASYVLAAPTSAAGAPVWRQLTYDDITGALPAGTAAVAGAGIAVSGHTVSLAPITALTVLANPTGSAAPPVATTVSSWFDAALGATRGSVLYRGASAWSLLAPGTSGYVLQSAGANADPQWAAATPLPTAGTGVAVSGSTVSLAPIATHTMLANATGSTAAPVATTVSSWFDATLGATQGAVLYRGASSWAVLAPGTAGYVLQSGGASANPSWVAQTASGAPVAGTGISVSGSTVSLAPVANLTMLANTSGASAAPVATTASGWIDATLGSTQGSLLYRSGAGWTALTPGTSGYLLQSGGANGNPSWVAQTASGAPVAGTGISVSGSTVSLAQIGANTLLGNATGSAAVPVAVGISPLLDSALGNAQGSLLQRGATGWTVLAPGSSGQVLQSGGPSANLGWAAATPLPTAGTGVAVSGSTVSLAPIATQTMLANATGQTAAPVATTLSSWFDATLGATQGAVLYRGASTWAMLAPGTAGQVLQSGGASANPSWAAATPAPTAGTGISVSGSTVSLATIGTLTMLANATGSTAAPVATTVSAWFDATLGATQGAVLYRGASSWAVLAPGTAGYFLQSGGASANPSWVAATAAPTAGTGISVSGSTVSLAPVGTLTMLANTTGSTAAPVATTVSSWFDATLGATQGSVLYRGATGWAVLAPGTAGQVLQSGGTSANPSWAAASGGAGSATLAGDTDVAITTPTDGDQFRYSGTASKWVNSRGSYLVAGYAPGKLTTSQVVVAHKFGMTATFPVNFGAVADGTTSGGDSLVNATASTVLSVMQCPLGTDPTVTSNWTTVGTITYAAGGHSPTFVTSSGTSVTFNTGDKLKVIGPASADSTLSDVFITLAANR